ncbi:MAG: PD40 domain-containing protein [Ignavibacteriaceae bacterium]|nr:PD40 domain-containing protein [Ignavibacteriaceae bacterium]
MKKFCLLLYWMSLPFLIQAQAIHLAGSSEDICMNPVFSPDGEKIAYTKANYKGLLILDLVSNSIKQITDEDAAGFAFKWSSDSKSILSRVSKYENQKRYNAVKIFDVENGKSNLLTEYKTMMPYLPEWANGDLEVFLPSKEGIEVYNTGKSKNVNSTKSEMHSYALHDKIILHDFTTGKEQISTPIKNADIINLTASPDGRKVAFEIIGGNMFSMNADGTGLIDLGKGNRPKWSFDGRKIIYMIAEDDGHTFTKSDIYSINPDGLEKVNLTNTNDLIEMNPCFSPDGNSITYDVFNDGSIYLMNLEQR